jgi:regulator of cell morphogenesis and NO signaling
MHPDEVPPPAEPDTASLIDTIITRYHRVHSRELPELIQLAERVEEAHRQHPSVPAGLAALLKRMLGELTVHMQKEELMLFPRMRKGSWPGIERTITERMAEHEEQAASLRALRALTHAFQVPDDGCATWRALYAGVAKFADDLVAHVHTENDILFPRFLAGEA